MEDFDFVLDGTRHRLSRAQVITSMRRQTPGRIQTYAVDIEGVRFPVKQVLAQALRIPVTTFVSTRAQDLLTKLGFDVVNLDEGDVDPRPASESSAVGLQLAVQFLAGRPDAQITDVLSAASAFSTWLGRGDSAESHRP